MAGIAVDRRLWTLRWGLAAEAEVQITQFGFEHRYTTFALGLGLRFHNFPWSADLPTSLSVYTGPSYAIDPPVLEGFTWSNSFYQCKQLLNYISIELAVALSKTSS